MLFRSRSITVLLRCGSSTVCITGGFEATTLHATSIGQWCRAVSLHREEGNARWAPVPRGRWLGGRSRGSMWHISTAVCEVHVHLRRRRRWRGGDSEVLAARYLPLRARARRRADEWMAGREGSCEAPSRVWTLRTVLCSLEYSREDPQL